MKGKAGVIWVVFWVAVSVQPAFSQCGEDVQNNLVDEVFYSSGIIGGVNTSINEMAIEDDIFYFDKKTVVCDTVLGREVSKEHLTIGARINCTHDKNNNVFVVEILEGEGDEDELFSKESLFPDKDPGKKNNTVSNKESKKERKSQPVYLKDGVWKN